MTQKSTEFILFVQVREKFDSAIDEAQELLLRSGHEGIPLEKYRFYKKGTLRRESAKEEL